MNECEKCYKLSRCYEQRGRCSEYRNIEDIRAEIEAVMQSYKLAGDNNSRDEGISGDKAGHQKGTERLLLETEVQKDTEKEEA